MGTDKIKEPFDENAALQALERLQQEIQDARLRREQKVEEFDAWLRASRSASHAERLAALEGSRRQAPTSPAAARAAYRGSESAMSTASSAARAMIPADWSADYGASKGAWRPAARDWLRDRRVRYAGAGALLLLLLAVWMWSGSGPATDQPAEATAVPSEPAAAPAASPAQPAPSSPARRPLEIELSTSRLVWMRVTVDGERVLEREVPANERLNFGADRLIVVRAGNGGSVRLSVNGQDQGLLGADGQIASRRLAAGAR